MAKRFTDTDKWKKIWFRKLTPAEKIFWQYICDNCDVAGVWEADFELASFYIGIKLNPAEITKNFQKQILELDEGKRWFIVDFIDFQYNCSIEQLNPMNKAHLSVIRILERYQIQGALKGLARGLEAPHRAPQELELDKDMDIKEGGVGETKMDIKALFIRTFSRNPLLPEIAETEKLLLEYTPREVEAAFRQAVLSDVRKLTYVKGILKKQSTESKKTDYTNPIMGQMLGGMNERA